MKKFLFFLVLGAFAFAGSTGVNYTSLEMEASDAVILESFAGIVYGAILAIVMIWSAM